MKRRFSILKEEDILNLIYYMTEEQSLDYKPVVTLMLS